jgi:hypothetical protein
MAWEMRLFATASVAATRSLLGPVRLRRCASKRCLMTGTIYRIAQGIDDIRIAVWDERGRLGKLLILFLLLITGAVIPLIPIAFIARRLAR